MFTRHPIRVLSLSLSLTRALSRVGSKGLLTSFMLTTLHAPIPMTSSQATDALGRGVTNLTQKLEGDDGDYIVAEFDDFVARAVKNGR